MITAPELQDDQEYEDICLDVREECTQYGVVKSLVVPRAKEGYPRQCEGSVFVEFQTADMAMTAVKALSGRKFANRLVKAGFVSTVSFTYILYFVQCDCTILSLRYPYDPMSICYSMMKKSTYRNSWLLRRSVSE